MSAFYTHDELVIDPHYGNSLAYAEYFDYDLLGKPVIWYRRVMQNPLLYLRRFFTEFRWHIMVGILCFIILTYLIIYLSDSFKSLLLFVANWIHTKRKLNAEKRDYEKHKKFLAWDDPDKYAMVYCQGAASRHGVCPMFDPIPKDLPDYEAVRFVFHEPWLINKTHRVLSKKPSTEFWGELVEGELEDAIQLATAEKRLRTRKPLSLVGKIAARRLLAQGERPVVPRIPTLSPEMKLILGWEQLYRQRVQESVEESYRWWTEQDKVLPVESREVTRKLKPILAKVAEEKKKKSPEGISPELFKEIQEITRDAYRASIPLAYESQLAKRSVSVDPQPRTSMKVDTDETKFVREIKEQEPRPKRSHKRSRKSRKSAHRASSSYK
ncbi:hypothetical protein FBUS_11235 [Fasciolopsis buskii]|uniref:Uncharacterized protein n=1 Tax=Fasciolopsis buskii TaxID=27845 RepID=A0A8E0RX13_9TREM|nr:hypothetical protein FBUS_11235 [Fasciolopsis buski]